MKQLIRFVLFTCKISTHQIKRRQRVKYSDWCMRNGCASPAISATSSGEAASNGQMQGRITRSRRIGDQATSPFDRCASMTTRGLYQQLHLEGPSSTDKSFAAHKISNRWIPLAWKSKSLTLPVPCASRLCRTTIFGVYSRLYYNTFSAMRALDFFYGLQPTSRANWTCDTSYTM